MSRDSHLWALEQILPWATAPVVAHAHYAAELARLNALHHDLFVYDIDGSSVSTREKHVHHPVAYNRRIVHLRAELYRSLLQRAVAAVGFLGTASIVMAVGDQPSEVPPDVPVFSYQKPMGGRMILLPDPEFVENDLYAQEEADISFRMTDAPKLNQVMFSGSSTGRVLHEEDVRRDAGERLSYAARFQQHPRIRFTIGFAAECATPEAAALLEAKPYFEAVDWHHQLLSRFIFSMDGNGATCSRVFRTLRSRSVLLKLGSPHQLFYFSGMIPWRHFIPVRDADDLDRLADEVTRADFPADAIADAANDFCTESLNPEALLQFTGQVLTLFQRHVLARMAR